MPQARRDLRRLRWQVRFPTDCGRFVGLAMSVERTDPQGGPEPLREVLQLEAWDGATQAVTWRLADVAANKGAKKGQGLSKKQREARGGRAGLRLASLSLGAGD